MADNDAPGVWPVWTPGGLLAGFIKRTTIHCYTQNMKALHGYCGFGESSYPFYSLLLYSPLFDKSPS